MKRTEAYYISHCDEYNCDMGKFEYTCPACGRLDHNYDTLWSEHDSILEGEIVDFLCEYCKVPLKIYYDKEEFEYIVEIKE
jgi:hypothetical protein